MTNDVSVGVTGMGEVGRSLKRVKLSTTAGLARGRSKYSPVKRMLRTANLPVNGSMDDAVSLASLGRPDEAIGIPSFLS